MPWPESLALFLGSSALLAKIISTLLFFILISALKSLRYDERHGMYGLVDVNEKKNARDTGDALEPEGFE
jgi:hypothetical protein